MNNEEILKKAIEKIIKNGYKGNLVTKENGKIVVECGIGHGIVELIFSHDFAKAFWGNGEKVTDQNTREEVYQVETDKFRGLQNYTMSRLPAWQYHLQQMVLEEDPIKYLEQFLDN